MGACRSIVGELVAGPLGEIDDWRMDLVVSVIVPLVSIAVGAGVTYCLNVRARRSMQFEDLIDAVIAAVAVEEASRCAGLRTAGR
jgi:hypothetical protein